MDRMDTTAPFVIQKPNQWDTDSEETDPKALPPPYLPRTGDVHDSFPRKPYLRPQPPNLVAANDYIPEPEALDLDLSMDMSKRARAISLREVRGAANGARASPTSLSGYWSSTSTASSDDGLGRLPELRESQSWSSTSSLASTLSSVSTTSSLGNRQLRLRVTSVLLHSRDGDGYSPGHVTPITNDSYEELVKSLRLIHDIDDDLRVEVMIRGTGGKLCQANMSDLRMHDVLDIRVFETLYRSQPPRSPPPQPQNLPSPLELSPGFVPAASATFPAPTASTSSPTSQPKSRLIPRPQRANTQHTFPLTPNHVFNQHSMPSAPATHRNSHISISPTSSPPSTIFNHSFSPFNTNRSHSPRAMSPPPLVVDSSATSSFMRSSSVQTRSPTPTSGASLYRINTVSSVSSVSSASLPPAYTDFYLTISPPIYEKGHNSVFPAKPFTLTRTDDGVFAISTVTSIRDVLRKKFQGCPDVIFYHGDKELGDDRRLCDMGINAGTKLRLVDKENYRLVPARLHDMLLKVAERTTD